MVGEGNRVMNLIEKIKQIKEEKDIFLEKGVEVGSAIIFDGIAGQVIPGVVGLRMDYKQKQMEKRLNIGIGLLIERVNQLEEDMRKLNDTEYRFVEESVFPLVFENIINESEEEKIKYIINGFESVIQDKITDQEIVLSYLDVLKALRLIDIEHLFKQTSEYRKQLPKKGLKLEIDLSEMGKRRTALTQYIYNKLEQLGLIQTITVDEISPEDGLVTKFGYNFLDFIKEKGTVSI